MKIRFALLVLVFTIIACSRDTEERPIAKQDYVNLLIDLHLFDAVAADYSLNSELRTIDSATLYSSLLSKYNTNMEEFETTMRWYTNHPEEMAEVYDEVFGELDKQNEVLNKEGTLFNAKYNDRIFSETKYKHYKGDTIKYPEPYLIEIKDTGTYLFEVKAKLLKEDQSEKPYLSIYFIKDKADSMPEERLYVVNMAMPKSNFSRDYQFVYSIENSDYKFIKIIIPDTPSRDLKKTKSLQVNKVRVLLMRNDGKEMPKVAKKK